LAEAPSHGKPVQLYDPRSRGAEAYNALAVELLDRNGVARPRAKRGAVSSAASDLPQRVAAEGNGGPRFWPYSK
jgi:chromosome partitioning protein